LCSAICHLPRQRLDLIPVWSRFLAVLRPITPDVPEEVVTYLRKEFGFLVRRKHQTFIETKLKFTRFIAELVNFGVFPPSEAFKCFKHLLMDFTHHQIEMACVFVEVCGRYLHKNPATRRRMKIYLVSFMLINFQHWLFYELSMYIFVSQGVLEMVVYWPVCCRVGETNRFPDTLVKVLSHMYSCSHHKRTSMFGFPLLP